MMTVLEVGREFPRLTIRQDNGWEVTHLDMKSKEEIDSMIRLLTYAKRFLEDKHE